MLGKNIGRNGVFYKSALNSLKREFEIFFVVSNFKLKNILGFPPILADCNNNLRHFYQ